MSSEDGAEEKEKQRTPSKKKGEEDAAASENISPAKAKDDKWFAAESKTRKAETTFEQKWMPRAETWSV